MTGKRKINTLTAFFAAACILLGAVFAVGVYADDEDYYYPTLYCNDEVWYKEDIFPLDRYFQSYYVPVSFFAEFEGVTITENERFNTLLISYAKNDAKFISFNVNTDTALTDSQEEFSAMTYTRDDERYVPAEMVCRALGFTLEYKRSQRTSEIAMRICDGTHKKSFDELIDLYARGERTEDTTSHGPETTEPPETSPIPSMNAKALYVTFDNVEKGDLDAILAVLAKYNAKATFFMKLNEIKGYEETIIKLVALGHSIGLAFDTDGYEADCTASFKAQNAELMRLIKHESRFVRIYGKASENAIRIAEDGEYCVWGWDVLFDSDSDVESELKRAQMMIAENDSTVIRFCGGQNRSSILETLLESFDKTKIYTAVINDATGQMK